MEQRTKWLPENLVSNKFLIILILCFPVTLLLIASFQPRIFFDKNSFWYLFSANIFFLHFLMFCFLSLLLIGKIGGLKLSDIGLRKNQIITIIWLPLVIWLAEQIVLMALIPFGLAELQINEIWLTENTAIKSISSFVANTLGTGLNEETFFRGFVFTQLYAKFAGNSENPNLKNFILAALLSSILFAIMHLQINPANFLIFTFGGLVGCLIYARTKNLFVGIGLHGVFNSPMPIFQTEIATAKLTVIFLMFVVIIFYPLFSRLFVKTSHP